MASPRKRKRSLPSDDELSSLEIIRRQRDSFLQSISRPVSPPRKLIQINPPSESGQPTVSKSIAFGTQTGIKTDKSESVSLVQDPSSPPRGANLISSPFKLTRIRDLGSKDNVDTVTLHEILGNPLIKEAWIFNFCFDIDWMMQYFDEDVMHSVQVKIIHGSWRKEDQNRILIDEACRKWTNVESITAYLPDPFGTHHSKAFILFTHDERAEIVIHTANMLARDWTNMTQAVWKSPSLPKLVSLRQSSVGPAGSGSRFKDDLLGYLKAYGSKLKKLVDELGGYDFNSIRGALIASVPSKQTCHHDPDKDLDFRWGYPRLSNVVKTAALENKKITSFLRNQKTSKHLVCQISSIATLPKDWFECFKNRLVFPPEITTKNVSIIFPTAANVRDSLDGYAAGVSIHTKAQSKSHLRQITSLRPSLCQWTGRPPGRFSSGRDLAAPHIKTYIQFESEPTAENPLPDIEWALLTSANLSTQAWGSEPKLPKGPKSEEDGYIQIQSFELGVVVWPSLFTDSLVGVSSANSDGYVQENKKVLQVEPSPSPLEAVEDNETKSSLAAGNKSPQTPPARMVPVFRKDMPDCDKNQGLCTLVGLRMPYDLPLTPYGSEELPWSPRSSYKEQDRQGRVWSPGQ